MRQKRAIILGLICHFLVVSLAFAALPPKPRVLEKSPPPGKSPLMGQQESPVDPRLSGVKYVGDPAPGYDTFANAVATLNADGNQWTLVVPRGKHTISKSLTVNANLHLKIQKGAILHIADRQTLTINCDLEAGPYQIFSCAGTGKVQFGPGLSARSGKGVGISEYKLRWWGAVGDGGTDDTTACQAALSAVYYEGGYAQPHHAVVVGTPYDVYAVTGLTVKDSTGKYPGQLIIDGKGATFKKIGVTSDPVIYLTQSGCRVKIHNWTFQGSCDYVYNHAVSGTPTQVRFKDQSDVWHVGVQASTDQSHCDAAYKWFYEARTGLLHVYGKNGGGWSPDGYLISTPDLQFKTIEVTIGGVASNLSPPWGYSLYGSAVEDLGTGYITVDNFSIKNFDVGIKLRGCEWCQISNGDIYQVNCAGYSVSEGSINTNNKWDTVSVHQCYGGNPNYPYNFWLGDEASTLINIDIEMTRAGGIYKSGPGLNIIGLYCEGTCYYNYPTATDFIYLKGCGGIKISGGTLAIGAAGAYPTSLVNLFHFYNTQGATIEGNWIYPGDIYVYQYEETGAAHGGGGIVFKGNQIHFGPTHKFANGLPCVKFEDNWFDPSTYYVCQPSLVQLDLLGVPTYDTLAAWRAYFSSDATTPLAPYVHGANVSWVKDTTTTTLTGTNSLKLTYTAGTNNETQFLGVGKTPSSGTWTKLQIFTVKSDTALNLSVDYHTIPLLGDNTWRVVYLMNDPNECTGGGMFVDFSSSAAGNVWIDHYSVKFFPTKQEAMAYVGKWDVQPHKKTLP